MATYSSVIAWKFPWTELPGRLQSIRLQRFGYDSACMHTIIIILIIFSQAIHISSLETVYPGPLPIFIFNCFLLLSCMSSLCILDINPLSDILFTDIVTKPQLGFSFGCSFHCAEAFQFVWFHLFFFYFLTCALCTISKNHCQEPCQKAFFLLFLLEIL